VERSGLRLDASWTKNRQEGFQPLPRALVERLQAFAEAGEPDRLYDRKNAQVKRPRNPLLFVSSHPGRALDKDLEAAGIPKHAPGGKLDFHACRLAYINLVIESGATVKEAQALARHATPELTMNTYGRTRPERLHETVERIAEKLSLGKKGVPRLYRQAVGVEAVSATPFAERELRSRKLEKAPGVAPGAFSACKKPLAYWIRVILRVWVKAGVTRR
jgi:hypothetical protein